MISQTIAIYALIGSLFIFMIMRIPVAISLIFSTLLTAVLLGDNIAIIPIKMVDGLNSFTLLAVPFFILAGEIMSIGGISRRLIDFANVFVGRMRGGLAMVNILASMFFGGISGSAVADTSSIGSVLIPMMKKVGYDDDYSVNVTMTASVQGVLIPPSHNVIIYSMAAGGLSVGSLFLAGVIPGIFLGLMIMIVSYYMAIKRNYPKGEKISLKDAIIICKDSFLGLFTIVIILGGVLTGKFTATESAAIAAVYAFIVTFFIYRDIPISKFPTILKNTLKTLSVVLSIIAASSAFAYYMAILKVPTLITNGLLNISDNKIIILILINIILLILGMFMDMSPLIIIMTPILYPVVMKLGYSPIQFGIVMMLNLSIGLITPPVGTVLFVGSTIGRVPIEKLTKKLWPFYATLFFTLMMLTFVPEISLWLPSKFGF